MSKRHIRDIRLFNNAGISLPVCYASDIALDLDKSILPMVQVDKATCKRCHVAYEKRYSWAQPRDGWPWRKK